MKGGAIAPRARINVKLVSGTNQRHAEEVLAGTPGLGSITQLFPDEVDDEMRRMYMLEVASDHVSAAVEQLRRNPNVESAHEAAPRKLVR
jgi:hypothetical protein